MSAGSKSTKLRDEFPAVVKYALAQRVGTECSRCAAVTAGPHEDPIKATNIGAAAHISAAAAGGPRYNSRLTVQERKSIGNAIWLCQNCAKLIDNDPTQFTEGVLLKLKRDAEFRAKHATGKPRPQRPGGDDADILRFFATCLDR